MHKIISLEKAKNELSKAEKVGQFFMPAAFINDTEEEIRQLEDLIKNHGVGGLCFFHSRASAATNFEGKKEIVRNENSFDTLKKLVQRYQSVSKHPLFIAIDAEWGLAMRIENTPQYPYAITLGAIQDNTGLIYQVGKNIAKDCKKAGIHWNLSPVVDINNNPNNPVIGYRSFGDDKKKVAQKALAYVKGTESEGVLTSIKHFPGHGDTDVDSHLGIPVINKTKEELLNNELYPFQELINEGVDAVMVGHLSVPALAAGKSTPSSISKEIIKDLLRNKMGFTGVVISDALNMHAVSNNFPVKGELEWLAFDAGNDILCFAEHTEDAIDMILQKATNEQIEESFERVWRLKQKAIAKETTEPDKELVYDTHLNRELAEQSITLYKGSENEITRFGKSDYCTLTFKRYNELRHKDDIISSLAISRNQIKNEENILLLLTPPQIKPNNNFGFLPEEIQFINEVLSTKNVVLYHFGNPYALKLFCIENTKATVIVYQNFKEFQDVATAHFQGKIKSVGKLPVKFKI
ncbi:glycoside hydrolase family 3 protein [Maribacter thermophilus]|uniref:glycoside hydrolase family 3 protein n=1 Tax=Maribacter thermophilus TaxID=1197874 RepID=UPI0006412473|nr:glycoside hydrolase family 3 protein [Maribacter thermophilus]